MSLAIRILLVAFLVFALALVGAAVSGAYTLGDLGGDDIPIMNHEALKEFSMDIAENGDIYIAEVYRQDSNQSGISVRRSLDDGTTWELWGSVTTAVGMGDYYTSPCLEVVEGVVNKCFLAYANYSNLFEARVMMASDDLTATTADFSAPVTVLSDPVEAYALPRFVTDASSYSNFFIYLVAQARYLAGGDDIIFTRSTDLGASFETPYKIGTLSSSDRDYRTPDISFGFGGYLNVAWEFDLDSETYDSALRVRRAANFGTNGLSDWGGVYGLGAINDGFNEWRPKIQASHVDNHVVIACSRTQDVTYGYVTLDPGVYVSTDSGETYPTYTTIPDGVRFLGDVKENPGSGQWYIGGQASMVSGVHRANIADLTSWSPLESFSDETYPTNSTYVPALALNPAHDFKPGLAFMSSQTPGEDIVFFDGEWRGDPGYPNMEKGFPVDLIYQPKSPPAVVDVNGDGDLEIVFGDTHGNIQIYQPDGSPLPGWPVSTGYILSDSPIAVGDLRNNGEMYIVAGTATGLVLCYDAQGTMADGDWPFSLEDGEHPAFVAIGAFGQGPYPRGIAVAVGLRGHFLSHHGRRYPDTPIKNFARFATNAPAIGDVDGDGLAEAVYANEETVVVTSIFTKFNWGIYMADNLGGSPTLGDINLDGSLNVVVPLSNGELHVFDSSGVNITGFPYKTPSGRGLSTVAIADMLGNSEPEMVTNELSLVHLFWYDGVEGIGWPADTAGWNANGSPIIGRVDGTVSSDVVLGARGYRAWAWNNFGQVIPGWPKASESNFYETSAMGDIDLDGSTEIVLISTTQLMVLDINQTPTLDYKAWPMAGHDHQRTGCSDCPEDLTSPVDDGIDGIDTVTRVSFAPPSPNPSNGSATFKFSVPGPAVVNLEVFDVRGHRVSLVTREEVGMGNHVASWGGLNDVGAPLASGIYFARLRVQGPGINEEMTRKITLAR